MIPLLITACVLLGIGFIAIFIRLVSIKRDLRKIGQKLDVITHIDTNTGLTTDTFDKDIAALIAGINRMLQNNRHGYLEVARIEAALKRTITNVSHDLRTPLTSAKGYLQMAEKSPADPQALSRYHAIIRGRLDELTTLMGSLFAFSRAVEGNMTPSCVNVGNMLRDTLVGHFAALEERGFEVVDDIPDAPAYWMCDEEALQRIVQNLITNAVVHGKDYLRVGLQGDTIEIANKVDDIQTLDVDNLFERFYTSDTSRTGKRTGLGLAIVKELTEKMGGSVTAQIVDELLIMQVRLPVA